MRDQTAILRSARARFGDLHRPDDDIAAITRRSFLQVSSLGLVCRFTSIAGTCLDWLMRWCCLGGPGLAGAG